MGMVKIKVKDDPSNDTSKWLTKSKSKNYISILNSYGKQGVQILQAVTPKDTGKTSESWTYKIEKNGKGKYQLIFENTNVVEGWANVAILLQYGHATRSGAWVEGRDYINPALGPLFDDLCNKLWKEVTK